MSRLFEIACYGMFALVVGLLSAWPGYQLLDDDHAVISLVFSHAGQRIGDCRMLTQDELNELPPNMRTLNDCPRERHPVRVQLRSGSKTLYSESLPPSGIWADGKSNVYTRIEVEAGVHQLFVGISDSGMDKGFDYMRALEVNLPAGRNLVVQFDEEMETILIR